MTGASKFVDTFDSTTNIKLVFFPTLELVLVVNLYTSMM